MITSAPARRMAVRLSKTTDASSIQPAAAYPTELVHRSVETFGREVIPRFDTDPVHRTTRQREAAG